MRAVPGVYKVAPVMRQIVAARAANGRRERLLLLGVDLLEIEDSYFRDYPSEQLGAIRCDPLAFMNSSTDVILSRSIADRLGVKLHGEFEIATASGTERFHVRGFVTIEATLTGAIGLLGGLMAGAGMGYILVKHTMVVQMGWYLPYQAPWHSLATVALVTLPVSAIAGLIPARAAGRLIVSRALEYE